MKTKEEILNAKNPFMHYGEESPKPLYRAEEILQAMEEYAQSHANQDGVKEEENTPVRIYRDVAVCQKVEAILKPEYMNTVYTWVQIKEAILATP